MSNNLSVTNSKGRIVNLLNDEKKERKKRKHQCTDCYKNFTTSGHLARHFRIHTGEKNFCCIYPGCPSRFSRQDNMMQHYRTHLSSKSRINRYCQQERRDANYDLKLSCVSQEPQSLLENQEKSANHPNVEQKKKTENISKATPGYYS